jgi:hypothetical protein
MDETILLIRAYTKIPHGIEHWGNSVWAFYYIAIVVWKVMIVAGFEILGINYDFCLAHYSGDRSIGIQPHRDASYANREAYGINLGRCDFTVGNNIYKLNGGEVYSFDCKTLHSADPSTNRWALNLWTAKSMWMAQIK